MTMTNTSKLQSKMNRNSKIISNSVKYKLLSTFMIYNIRTEYIEGLG